MKTATLYSDDLSCPSCTTKIEGALKKIEGVDKKSISIFFNSGKVKFDFDDSIVSIEEIESAISTLGYEITKTKVN